jgi:hypothetical protein
MHDRHGQTREHGTRGRRRGPARIGASNLCRDARTSSRVRALSRGAKGLPVRSASLNAPRP